MDLFLKWHNPNAVVFPGFISTFSKNCTQYINKYEASGEWRVVSGRVSGREEERRMEERKDGRSGRREKRA